MTMRTVVDYLEVLSSHVARDDFGEKRPLYRGQGSVNWKLVPSAHRYREGRKPIRNFNDLTKWMLAAGPFLQVRPLSRVEWLVLAQHHGIPTALLDWSYNPLAALYFACDEFEEDEGCVLSLNTTNVNFDSEVNLDLDLMNIQENHRYAFAFPVASVAARAASQYSVMTWATHRDADRQNDDYEADIIFRVPHANKRETRKALSLLGFSRRQVFADLDHAAKDYMSETL